MGTTADKLNYLLVTKDEIKAAITDKGVDVSSSTFRECAQKIREIPQDVLVFDPSSIREDGDVKFFDYDGTLLYSFTKDEFLALDAMPSQPQREGLKFQEWNWSLEEAKAFVADYRRLDVGAIYVTDDGISRFYIDIPKTGRRTIYLSFYTADSNGRTNIDWGDGTTTSWYGSASASEYKLKHAYNTYGKYCIKLTCLGEYPIRFNHFNFGPGDNYTIIGNGEFPYLYKVELGDNIKLDSFASLSTETINIPKGVTSLPDSVGQTKIRYLSIPKGVTSIGHLELKSLQGISLPNTITSGLSFGKSLISSIVIPPQASLYGRAFYECSQLKEVILPEGIKTIDGNCFYGTTSLHKLSLPSTVETISRYAFYNCYLYELIIPEGVTSIGSDLSGYNFMYVKFPKSFTCQNPTVSLFYSSSSIKVVDFTDLQEVPTIYGLFNDTVPYDCKVVVPLELFDTLIDSGGWKHGRKYICSDVEPTSCSSLEIRAYDVAATKTTTTIVVTAIVNGTKITNGDVVENVVYRACVTSSSFSKNTTTEPLIKEVSYSLFGVTATTTFIQEGVAQ